MDTMTTTTPMTTTTLLQTTMTTTDEKRVFLYLMKLKVIDGIGFALFISASPVRVYEYDDRFNGNIVISF